MPYKDPKKKLENNAKYREEHPEMVLAAQRRYRDTNRKEINARRRAALKQRWANDPEFRQRELERSRRRRERRRIEQQLLKQWGIE